MYCLDFEPGIPDAKVYLLNAANVVIDSNITNFDGHYQFELDPSTDYTVHYFILTYIGVKQAVRFAWVLHLFPQT
jgi:hypothetical protein